jgi:Copper amine oxidase N-terminal domain./NPCBM/NEW2 domain.
MKKNVAPFLAGILSCILLSQMILPAAAALVSKTIQVYTGVDIYLNEVKLNPKDANGNPVEVFVYNGTTYLPARAIADAFQTPINWEGTTNSIYIGRQSNNRPAVLLQDLDYFNSGGKRFAAYRDIKDNLGNEYSIGIQPNFSGWGSSSSGSKSSWQSYYINGQYSNIAGKLVLGYESRNTSSVGYFCIYGDDRLLYKSSNITSGALPIDVNVDISGVLELKIEFVSVTEQTLWGPYPIAFYAVGFGLYS